MLAVGWNVTQPIEADLRQTAEVMPLKPNRDDYYSYPEVTAPTFSKWRVAARRRWSPASSRHGPTGG